MTPEELQEIERAHENAIWRHNREARPWATMRRAVRLARDLTRERARTAEIEADRDALAAKIETMLRDEEDARALRLAEHAAREDLAREVETLRAELAGLRAAISQRMTWGET